MAENAKNTESAPDAEKKSGEAALKPGESVQKTVHIDAIPRELLERLDEKGIAADTIRLAVMSDMNADGVRCDNWLLVTDTDLICVGGSKMLLPREGRRLSDTRRLKVEFGEISCEYYPLAELSSFKVEEHISTAMLTAKRGEKKAEETKTDDTKTDETKPDEAKQNEAKKPDGETKPEAKKPEPEDPNAEYLLITRLTNTRKANMNLFVKYIGQLKEKGEMTVSDKDKPEELFCPKCGNRYADAKRKICPKCMDKNRIIKRTSVFFLKYKLNVAIILGVLVLSSALGVLSPYVSSGFYYDEVLNTAGKYYGQLLLVLGIIVSVRLLSTLINIISGVASSTIAARIVYDLRKVIFSSIGRLSISFFTGRQTGGLMTQVNNDANTIYWFFVDGFPYFVINLVQVAALIIIMLIMNPVLTLLALVTVPLVIFTIRTLFERLGKLHAKRYSNNRALNAILSDVLTGVRVVKAFSKEKEEIGRFNDRSHRLASSERKLSTFSNVAFPAVNFLIYISTIVVWGVGGWMVIKGNMTYGLLLTFSAYMHMIYGPMYFFVDMMYWLSDAFNAMHRLLEVMDAVPDVTESENPVRVGEVKGKVSFKKVEFSYEKNRKVIDGVDFEIEPGKVIGIVGHTGAGKSTLANLLIRLYDVTSGEILIDDINVKDLAFEDLRRNVAIVSQETYLFAGTILDNIRYAKPDASYEEIVEASRAAGAHDFIIKLPDAYSTYIGFGYKDLSGGERQRVSIARAILRDPKILILDEATAAMDTETERRIQTALERLSVGRTTIIIAHRLSTLRSADKLIVIENGKMPEFGTHTELIAKKGIYFKLYKLQMEALKNIGVEE